MQTFKEYLTESSLSRVLHHTKNTNIGMISASRGEHTPQQNKEANKSLEKDVRSHGYGVVHVKGHYTENKGQPNENHVEEHSMLVLGKKGADGGALLGHLKHLGEKYKQDSIMHKSHDEPHAHLHGTKEGGWPGKGQTHNVGEFHPNRAAEFTSHLKGNKSFTFSEGYESKFLMDEEFFNAKEKAETMVYEIK
jgi:hypothetical protein